MEVIDKIINGELNIQDFIESQSKEIIQNRLMGCVSDEYDKTQGSFMYDTITPNTFEIMLMYVVLSQILKVINPNTTYGEFLKGYAESFGVNKKVAEYATGFLLVFGIENTIIPENTLFSTEVPANQSVSPKYYLSTQEVIIPQSGKVEVPIKAETAGASQNVRSNEIVVVCKNIPGISSITNPESITNGTDAETDEELRKRFLSRAQNPPSSGNKKDYERWAREIEGVDGVIVEPLWAGPGTVKLTISFNGGTADDTVIEKVKNHIDPYPEGTGAGKAPIGAIVSVGTVVMSKVNVKILGISYKDEVNIENVNSEIQTAISEYLKTISLGEIIRIIKIEAAIGGINDVIGYDDVLIALEADNSNYKSEDIQLNKDIKISLGEVIYV